MVDLLGVEERLAGGGDRGGGGGGGGGVLAVLRAHHTSSGHTSLTQPAHSGTKVPTRVPIESFPLHRLLLVGEDTQTES